jgi:hypothetical protein
MRTINLCKDQVRQHLVHATCCPLCSAGYIHVIQPADIDYTVYGTICFTDLECDNCHAVFQERYKLIDIKFVDPM